MSTALESTRFAFRSSVLIVRVIRAVFKRRKEGRTALSDQSLNTHITHLTDHIELFDRRDPGPEGDVNEQLAHAAMRGLLAWHTHLEQIP